ncbi:MAG: AAA family ATPase [Thermoplasmataceae archaeon]
MQGSNEVNEDIEKADRKLSQMMDEIQKYYVGDREIISKIIASLLASGHVLLEDNPGIGKTFVAKLISTILGIQYKRIQFTPDLLPSDILGTKVYRPAKGEFELVKGPIFCNLLLADEINRAPPKTQSALLEAMEERQVTIEGETIPLPKPFIVIATQNPIEFEGTYPLPEAQMDRFMIRLSFGYPPDDTQILKRRIAWTNDDPSAGAMKIFSPDSLMEVQKLVENSVTVDDKLISYISSFGGIRKDSRVLAGPSPRGLISLMRLARAMALLDSRDFVIPDDVKMLAKECLSHRIVLKPDQVMEDIPSSKIIDDFMKKEPVPK